MNEELTHSIYGRVGINVWYDLYGHRSNHGTEKLDGYEIMFMDSKDKPFVIRGIRCDDKKSKFDYTHITVAPNDSTNFSDTHLILASAFRVTCADGQVNPEEHAQLRAIATTLGSNEGVLALEIARFQSLSEVS